MVKPIVYVKGLKIPNFWIGTTCQKCGKGKYQKVTDLKGWNMLRSVLGMSSDKLKCDNPECGNEVEFD